MSCSGEFADAFVEAFGFEHVSFEAPNKASQFALLDHFGREVALCNIRLEELLRVEIYRRGLHSDAFGKPQLRPDGAARRGAERGAMMRWMKIDTALPVEPVEAVVVVDVIRAMTTAVTAVALGRRCLPVPSLEAARADRPPDSPLPPRWRARRRAAGGFDLDNSPAQIDRPQRSRAAAGALVLVGDAGSFTGAKPRRGLRGLPAQLRRRRRAQLLVDRHRATSRSSARRRGGEFREEDQLCCARIAAILARAGFRAEKTQPPRS